MCRGNEFQQPGNQIVINAGVSKAVVVGNVFTGKQSVVSHIARAQIGLNANDDIAEDVGAGADLL